MDDQTLNYDDSVAWLFGLQFFGVKLGLENIQSLAAAWGNPERRFPVIHIAGTNGKGSTASFIAAGLQAAGYRTGLYTSPHLVDFTERVRVDGVRISRESVAEYARRLRPEVERRNATFFEATTLMAFQYFADSDVDVAVIETGLGGRLDATNIVQPVMTVITSLSLEHREHLGDRLEDIAREKAGIIKEGVPLVAAEAEAAIAEILATISGERGCPFDMLEGSGEVISHHGFEGMDCRLPEVQHTVRLGLIGAHQMENARLAVRVLRMLRERGFPRLTESRVEDGLRDVRVHTGLRGRMQQLSRRPELVIDVGHNPEGLRAMLETWSAVRDTAHTDFVFGVLKTKDLAAMFELLRRYPSRSVTLVEAVSHEARPLVEMQRLARDAGLEVRTADSVADAVQDLLARDEDASVLLFGSHYVVGEYLRRTGKNE